MIRNENGTILPLTLILTLFLAALLLTWSQGLQSQVLALNNQQQFHELNLLEKQCVYELITEISDPDFVMASYTLTKTIYWDNGVKIRLEYIKFNTLIDVTYDLYYNEGRVKGKISYNISTRTYDITY